VVLSTVLAIIILLLLCCCCRRRPRTRARPSDGRSDESNDEITRLRGQVAALNQDSVYYRGQLEALGDRFEHEREDADQLRTDGIARGEALAQSERQRQTDQEQCDEEKANLARDLREQERLRQDATGTWYAQIPAGNVDNRE
jgi:chromosome segregation ATPase